MTADSRARAACSEAMRHRYIRRLSGPLLDRFDLRVAVKRPNVDELMGPAVGEASATVACRVAAAREIARARGVETNADIDGARLDDLAPLSAGRRRCFGASSKRVGSLAAGSTECDGSPARCATSTAVTRSSPTATWPSRCSSASTRSRDDSALARVNGRHDIACAVALADLPMMGPGRLRALLARWTPSQAWQAVVKDRAADDPRVAAGVWT